MDGHETGLATMVRRGAGLLWEVRAVVHEADAVPSLRAASPGLRMGSAERSQVRARLAQAPACRVAAEVVLETATRARQYPAVAPTMPPTRPIALAVARHISRSTGPWRFVAAPPVSTYPVVLSRNPKAAARKAAATARAAFARRALRRARRNAPPMQTMYRTAWGGATVICVPMDVIAAVSTMTRLQIDPKRTVLARMGYIGNQGRAAERPWWAARCH